MKLLGFLLLLCSFKSFAQCPFEKFPAIKYKKLIVKGSFSNDSSYIATTSYGKYKLFLIQHHSYDIVEVLIVNKGKATSKLKLEGFDIPLTLCDTIYAADINGDGKTDFKLKFWNNGSGLAGSLVHKIYFFNNGFNKFRLASYTDFFDGVERDFNNDRKYEIIGKVYTSYEGHGYMIYNLFN